MSEEGKPSGAERIWMLPPCRLCLPDHQRSTPGVGPGARQRSVLIKVPSSITCVWPTACARAMAC
jgi:hypothetical protein